MKQIIADGGCLCGAVRYTVNGEVLWSGHCHCESCRRQTSSPVASFFCVKEQDMMFHGDNIGTHASSEGVERGFCRSCGSAVYYMNNQRPGEIDLHAMTLDNPDMFEAQAHYHWNEKLPWLEIHDNLPKETQEE